MWRQWRMEECVVRGARPRAESYVREFSPFTVVGGNKLVVSEKFYGTIKGHYAEKALRRVFPNFEITDRDVRLSKSVSHHDYMLVCNAFLEWYDARHWYHALGEECRYVELPQSEAISFLLKAPLPDAVKKLSNAISDVGGTAFVKFQCKSTKHEYPPGPVTDGADAINHLMGSSQLRGLLAKDVADKKKIGILVRRWHEIPPSNEFRVFVRSGKVVGISQLDVHVEFPAMHLMMALHKNSMFDAAKTLLGSLDMPYTNAALDVWFTFEEEEEDTCVANLIEINVGEPWSGCESGLFTWKELLDHNTLEIRYASS